MYNTKIDNQEKGKAGEWNEGEEWIKTPNPLDSKPRKSLLILALYNTKDKNHLW